MTLKFLFPLDLSLLFHLFTSAIINFRVLTPEDADIARFFTWTHPPCQQEISRLTWSTFESSADLVLILVSNFLDLIILFLNLWFPCFSHQVMSKSLVSVILNLFMSLFVIFTESILDPIWTVFLSP